MTPSIIKNELTSQFKTLKDDLLNFSSFHAAKKISVLFDTLITDVFLKSIPLDDLCLIAGGSYSNLELCPYSDIDLMILYNENINYDTLNKKLKGFFYLFWDASIDLAQSVRTIKDAINLMETDLNTYTSFVNARYIAGNKDLYDDFKDRFRNIDASGIFLIDVMKNLRKRRLINVMVDNNIFLLEPDVKDGIGGLRDYSWCEWAYYIAKKPVAFLNFLHNTGINGISYDIFSDRTINTGNDGEVGREDLIDLYNSKEFILKIRIMMHLIASKKVDRLTFDIQEKVASAFFYKDGKFLNKIELFMQDYYLNAKNMHIVSRLIINLLIKPSFLIQKSRLASRAKIETSVNLGDNFFFDNGLISIKDKEKFLSDIENPFKLLEIYYLTGERLDAESINLLKKASFLHKKNIRDNGTAKNFFLNLLKKKKRVYKTLLLMHEIGLLGALIPEFEKINSLSTNDIYHIYTVDAHSLNGIHYLEEYVNLRIHKDLKDVIIDISEEDMLILNFSLLLHDIGKGYSSRHEKVGAKIASKIAERLGFSNQAEKISSFLILHHFLLPLTSERRDMHDPATIRAVADTLKDIKHLKLLFAISLCDSMAVSPARFNLWRKTLLVELYYKTLSYLENKAGYLKKERPYADEIYEYTLSHIGENGYSYLKNILDININEYIKNYLNSFYYVNKYLMRHPPEKILLHMAMLEESKKLGFFNYKAILSPDNDYYELIICGPERKSIFSDITGILSYNDFNIMSADINTRKDENFIDVFFIHHIYKKRPDELNWNKIMDTLRSVFEGKLSLAEMFRKKIERDIIFKKTSPHVALSCDLYNNLSDEFTVIEIQAQDRKGLLYDIAKVFNRFDINILVSKITTQGDKAFDTFYVKDEHGNKIKNMITINKIKKSFIDIL